MRYDLQADCGALPGDSSQRQHNTDALNAALERLQPGDSLVVTEGETFHLAGVPMGQFGRQEEIAAVIAFLMSD